MTRIKEETDIVSVVREYVSLKPAGTAFKGLCPFHREKTPSFHVNPQRQIYKCFGCGEGGDVLSFLMNLQGMSFPEVIELLARPLNIDLARYLVDNDESEGERQAFFRGLEAAAEIYGEAFWSDAGSESRNYLLNRQFTEEVLRRYEVGHAGASSQEFEKELEKRGVGRDLALRCDLLRQKDGAAPFAYFRSRVIFPIKNIAQRVAGFGGRILGDGEPKYLNSAESPYFNKRQILYGFAVSRIPIARHRKAILVEGYLDLLALAQVGYVNSVATCGTAFTREQAAMLRRGCSNVYVLFDGDKAGLKGAVKTAGIALAEGLEPRIARLPQGEDPADFLQERDASELAALLEAAPGYLRLLRDLADESGRGREGRERAIKTGLMSIASVEDPIRRTLLLEEMGDLFGLPPAMLAGEMEKVRRGAQRNWDSDVSESRVVSPSPNVPDEPIGQGALQVDTLAVERSMLVHVILDDSGRAAETFMELWCDTELRIPRAEDLRRDLESWRQNRADGEDVTPASYIQSVWHDQDEDYRRLVSELLADQEGAHASDHERIVRDCHQRLDLVRNRRREVEALRALSRGREGTERP